MTTPAIDIAALLEESGKTDITIPIGDPARIKEMVDQIGPERLEAAMRRGEAAAKTETAQRSRISDQEAEQKALDYALTLSLDGAVDAIMRDHHHAGETSYEQWRQQLRFIIKMDEPGMKRVHHAIEALLRALHKHGTIDTLGLTEQKSVTVTAWRAEAELRGMGDKTFQRAKRHLLDSGNIAIQSGLVWIQKPR